MPITVPTRAIAEFETDRAHRLCSVRRGTMPMASPALAPVMTTTLSDMRSSSLERCRELIWFHVTGFVSPRSVAGAVVVAEDVLDIGHADDRDQHGDQRHRQGHAENAGEHAKDHLGRQRQSRRHMSGAPLNQGDENIAFEQVHPR